MEKPIIQFDSRAMELWAAETRINAIRMIVILVFHLRHLVEIFNSNPELDLGNRTQITAVVIAWAAMVFLVFVSLGRRRNPPWLKWAAVGWDLTMTSVLIGVANGLTDQPIVLVYFIIIATLPLRLSLRLVWGGTIAAMLAYMTSVGFYAFVEIGAAEYYANPSIRIPRGQQAFTLLALGAAGLLAGQVVRQSNRMLSPIANQERPAQ